MRLTEVIRAVWADVNANRFRVFLTTLGIIVGSLTIALVVGFGLGGQAAITDQFSRFGPGTITVASANARYVLNAGVMEAIREQAVFVKDATIAVSRQGQATIYNSAHSGNIYGVYDNYLGINGLEVEVGEFITPEDNLDRRRVAVIGYDLVEKLYDSDFDAVIGSTIRINSRSYEVVGVLKRRADNMGIPGFGTDEAIYVPFEVAIRYTFSGATVRPSITAIAADLKRVQDAIYEIQYVLQDAYPNATTTDFRVSDAGSRLESAKEIARTVTMLLVSVAVVVLIVGGIGIMNVLLVSVKERTREIGILKAIGARKRDILLQFLFQSVFISIFGGIVGVALSFAIGPFVKVMDISYMPSVYGSLLALFFSIATGSFFGYYPALKAASLRPIEALNEE